MQESETLWFLWDVFVQRSQKHLSAYVLERCRKRGNCKDSDHERLLGIDEIEENDTCSHIQTLFSWR